MAGRASMLGGLLGGVGGAARRLDDEIHHLRAVIRAGLIAPVPPQKLIAIARALSRYGALGGGLAAAAIRNPNGDGVADELGTLTFAELDRRSNALANALIASRHSRRRRGRPARPQPSRLHRRDVRRRQGRRPPDPASTPTSPGRRSARSAIARVRGC